MIVKLRWVVERFESGDWYACCVVGRRTVWLSDPEPTREAAEKRIEDLRSGIA